MIGTGLNVPAGRSAPGAFATGPTQPATPNLVPGMAAGAVAPTFSMGGLMEVKPLRTLQYEEQQANADAAAAMMTPEVTGIAAMVRRHWELARRAKETRVERDILAGIRAGRGEYDPAVIASIREQGGSEIYMMVYATKARQAKALLVDTLMGTGNEKPWTLAATAIPDPPPEVVNQIMQGVSQMVAEAEMSPYPLSVDEVRQLMEDARDKAMQAIESESRERVKRAEKKIEDDLQEGCFVNALDEFLDDLMYSPSAFMQGPVYRNVKTLKWEPGPDGKHVPVVTQVIRPHWERVDPLMVYPAPWARSVDDAYLCIRHRLSRQSLQEMIGVDGYSEAAIRTVLAEHGVGGLREWLMVDTERATAEGRDLTALTNQDDLIDAIQYWGSVMGQELLDWGMDPSEVPVPTNEYQVECWVIGAHVIKCVLNPDPLGRRNYYSDSFRRVPGSVWGVSLHMAMRDVEDMCNAAARALANNMGIASGPQVWVNVERMPDGEQITTLFPWKVWQGTSDPSGSTAKAIEFFQPSSNANELMQVFDRFSAMADEYTGIPRYMTGMEGTPGAGRTASGLSMMIGNASKTIKSWLSSIDLHILSPAISRWYEFRIQHTPDPDITGDLRVVARGALSLIARENAQVRINEFLQVTSNPIDQQLLGPESRLNLLRAAVAKLDLNPDDVVPSISAFRRQQLMLMAAQQQAPAQPEKPEKGEKLMNGAPTTDNFSPTKRT